MALEQLVKQVIGRAELFFGEIEHRMIEDR